jgi:hypothetical protein
MQNVSIDEDDKIPENLKMLTEYTKTMISNNPSATYFKAFQNENRLSRDFSGDVHIKVPA